jgi:hypothetical protein
LVGVFAQDGHGGGDEDEHGGAGVVLADAEVIAVSGC